MNRRWIFWVGAAFGVAGGVYSVTVREWTLAAACGCVAVVAAIGLTDPRMRR